MFDSSPFFRILHLSDIHIGKDYIEPGELVPRIISDIKHHSDMNIDCIVVTGDIFDANNTKGLLDSKERMDAAVNFFTLLLERINENQDTPLSKNDVIFVPGNHDMIRDTDFENRWEKYKTFLTNFYVAIPSQYNSKNFSIIKEYEKKQIVLVGYNSCCIKAEKVLDSDFINKFRGYTASLNLIRKKHIDRMAESFLSAPDVYWNDFGSVNEEQIFEIETAMKGVDGKIVVALFHHHFYLFPEVLEKGGDKSLIRNHARFSQHLKKINARLILHGHKHFNLDAPFSFDDYGGVVDVIAGGSLNCKDVDAHYFSLIDIHAPTSDIRVTMHKFIYNEEMFTYVDKVLPQTPPLDHKTQIEDYVDADFITKIENQLPELINTAKHLGTIKWFNNILVKSKSNSDIVRLISGDSLIPRFIIFSISLRSYFVNNNYTLNNDMKMRIENYLEKNLLSDFPSIESNLFIMLSSNISFSDTANEANKLLTEFGDHRFKTIFSFYMLSMFITDMLLFLTNKNDDLINTIKHKSNANIDWINLQKHIPSNRISITFDLNKRRIDIHMDCDNATAHKMAALIVNEFELALSGFEEIFTYSGFRIYYIRADIVPFDEDGVSNNNFEAYTPTIMPLLSGGHLYSTNLVFARELIQNSIDAIKIREIIEPADFSKGIKIMLQIDENQKVRSFKIKDHGIGMGRTEIERYLTSIGRSFYTSDDYRKMNITYSPISTFGIGFLSSFLVCNNVTIHTRKISPLDESLELSIPNIEGCFFAEASRTTYDIGTEIDIEVCSEDNPISLVDLISYIDKHILGIQYDVKITWQTTNKLTKFIIVANDDHPFDVSNTSVEALTRSIPNTPTIPYAFVKSGLIVDSENSASFQKNWWNRYLPKKLGDLTIKRDNDIADYVISKHAIREPGNEFFIFIPFDEEGVIDVVCNTIEEMSKYPYGLFITDLPNAGKIIRDENSGYSPYSGKIKILNSGILVEQASLFSLFDIDMRIYSQESETAYNNVVFNFPPNWINMDLSREKVLGFSGQINKNELKEELVRAGSLILNRLRNSKDLCIKLIHLQEVSRFFITIATDIFADNGLSEIRREIEKTKVNMTITFSSHGIKYSITADRGISKDVQQLLVDLKKNIKENYVPISDIGGQFTSRFNISINAFLRKFEAILSKTRIESMQVFDEKLSEEYNIVDYKFLPHSLTMYLFSIYLLLFMETEESKYQKKASHTWLSIEWQFIKEFTTLDFQNNTCNDTITFEEIEEFLYSISISNKSW